ncbi:MAG TPA: protein-L-isoaspartate(D-aspartate) O-methyltransferase [Verrucomicrobiae bacterium]|nr:protein-L-isoaspartate(D-aspartate) O-methyltransferase [Verrucomicrobiae bacterium]
MDYSIARKKMVEQQIVGRGIKDRRVIDAMLKIPRHLFVEEAMVSRAYSDGSLPIGEKQTISQPYTVALMSELLELKGSEKVLEIGTGSGYQSALLAMLAGRVYTIERIRPLAMQARKVLDSLRLLNVNIRIGDGTHGWEEEAPFDAVIVTAGAGDIPPALVEQLAPGGRLVIPVGSAADQTMLRVTRSAEGAVQTERFSGCRFVELVGGYGWNSAG